MLDHREDSGQVMLTSAILFAVIIIIIALMLNNIIYATNVAYIGFIDGSKYEDLSIRQLTTKEATGSYQNIPNENTRAQYISDWEKAINYITNPKGKYVKLTPDFVSAITPGLTITQTKWNLVITNKESTVKYAINTGSANPTAMPSPPPSQPTVSFSSATYTVNEGGACIVTIKLNHPYCNPVQVDYATITGGTAIPESDPNPIANYIDVSGSLTIDSGETSGSFSVTTIDDNADTLGTLTILVDITGVTNAVEGNPSTATISITDIVPDPTPTPTPSPYSMSVDCTPVREQGGAKKDVTITTVVENTGTSALTNVYLELVSPTGKPFVTGSSPQLIELTLNPGDIRTIVWVIRTQNQNDLVDVQVKATADQSPGVWFSGTWMDI